MAETPPQDDQYPNAPDVPDEHESSAVLDDAHVGDIHGAFGTIREHDLDSRRSWTARLLTLLAIMGPGLIVMVGDNDAGGVATYSQAGQNFGLSLLWALPSWSRYWSSTRRWSCASVPSPVSAMPA